MQVTEVSVVGVRSAVIVLRRPESPMRFLLFPMVHIGQPAFYAEVARRLRDCQIVVAEGTDMASSTGLAYAIAMRLTGQRHGHALVKQDIDYAALGVPTVWPELGDKRTSARHRRLPVLEWLAVAVLVPVLTVMMAVGGRRWLLRQRMEVSDDSEVRIFLRFLQDALVHERDRELLETLARIHEERQAEPIDVAVAYGAAHMPAVVQGLRDRYRYRARTGEWLTVIDF
ncbi:MAG: hypothetical protein J2P15_20175 [Micromonosporaceae bacterium]|nr:hypothetical protein [Micromonosporaceae bacterium]